MATMVVDKNFERERMTSSIAMVMTLISFSMLFATLMLGYVAYRFTSVVWPPLGMQRASLEVPTLSTLIILMSSLSYYMSESSFLQNKLKAFKNYYFVTLLLGASFMVSQMFLWQNLKLTGIFVDSTVFGSIIYAFTWVHAGHMVVGLLALLFLIPSLRGKRNEGKTQIWLKSVGQFWHFLGIVWVIMYFSIFIF
jgi:cytochrome c oxidase subunit 3